jgi:drug/metabolite transporter (DMT)-like permease
VTYALGQGLLAIAMARVGATFSSLALLLLPVSAAFLSWALLGETLSINQAVGGAVVLASILAARLAGR